MLIFDEFKEKDCIFVVECLKTKGLHSNLVIFPRVGAFEQLFGPGREEFEQKFSKIQMPGGLPGEDVEASI